MMIRICFGPLNPVLAGIFVRNEQSYMLLVSSYRNKAQYILDEIILSFKVFLEKRNVQYIHISSI